MRGFLRRVVFCGVGWFWGSFLWGVGRLGEGFLARVVFGAGMLLGFLGGIGGFHVVVEGDRESGGVGWTARGSILEIFLERSYKTTFG